MVQQACNPLDDTICKVFFFGAKVTIQSYKINALLDKYTIKFMTKNGNLLKMHYKLYNRAKNNGVLKNFKPTIPHFRANLETLGKIPLMRRMSLIMCSTSLPIIPTFPEFFHNNNNNIRKDNSGS